MHRFIFEIDTHSDVALMNESIYLEDENKKSQTEKLLQLKKPRKIQTFILNGIQYFKAADIFWLIKKDKTIETIGQTKYYKKRSESDYEIQ